LLDGVGHVFHAERDNITTLFKIRIIIMGSLRSFRQNTPLLPVKKQYPYKFVGPKYDPDLDVLEIA
jgi:hypothetical protein